MKLKSIATSVVILGVVAAGVWYFKRDKTVAPSDPRIGKDILDKVVLDKVTSVVVHTPGGDVNLVNTGTAAAPTWVVKEFYDLPADFEKLSKFVGEIRDAKFTRFGSALPERIAKMEFNGTKVEMHDKAGTTLWSCEIGGSAAGGGHYIKIGAEVKAYVASFDGYIDATAKNWADSKLIPAKPDDIVGVEIGFTGGDSLNIKREKAGGAWTADGLKEGETVKAAEVDSLLSRLTDLRFTETSEPVLEPTVAGREGARTIKLKLLDGRTLTAVMSRQPAPPPPPPPAKPADGAKPPAPPPKPAIPVEIFVSSSNASDPINSSMVHRGFQIAEWTFTSLPADRAALIQAAPPKPAAEAAPAPAAPASTAAPATPPATTEAKPAPATAPAETKPEPAPVGK